MEIKQCFLELPKISHTRLKNLCEEHQVNYWRGMDFILDDLEASRTEPYLLQAVFPGSETPAGVERTRELVIRHGVMDRDVVRAIMPSKKDLPRIHLNMRVPVEIYDKLKSMVPKWGILPGFRESHSLVVMRGLYRYYLANNVYGDR